MTNSVLNVITRISSLCKDRHAYLRDVCAYAYENIPKMEHDNDVTLNLLFYPLEIASNIANEQQLFLPLSLQGILFLLRLRRITDKTLYVPPNIPIPKRKKSFFGTSDVTVPTEENSLSNGSSSDTRKFVDVVLETIRKHRRSSIEGVAPLVLQCLAEFIYSCECVGKVRLVDCFQSAFEAQLGIKSLPEFGDSNTMLKKILTIILKKRTNAFNDIATSSSGAASAVSMTSIAADPSSRISFPAQVAAKLTASIPNDCLEESYNATLVSIPEDTAQLSVNDEDLLVGTNSQPEWLMRYDLDCYEILVRICYLSTRHLDDRASLRSMGLRCRRLSCTLLAHFLNEMDVEFASSTLFESALHKNITLSLLYNCISEDSELYCITLETLYYLVVYHAAVLKSKVIVFILGILLPMVESKQTSYHQKNTILTFFDFALRNPQVLSDWFTNFDCVQGMTNLCEIFVSRLSKLAKMSHISSMVTAKQDEALRFTCIKVLCTFVRSIESISNGLQISGYSMNSEKSMNENEVKEKEKYESGKTPRHDEREEDMLTQISSELFLAKTAPLIEVKLHNDDEDDDDDDVRITEELGGENRAAANTVRSSYTDIEQLLRGKKAFDAVVKAFNARDHTAALSMAEKSDLLSSQSPEVVARFLLREELDPVSIGEFLCKENEERKSILTAFIGLNDFTGLTIDEAMRLFLGKFKLPGEAQVIDRVMEIFAEQYCRQNPENFSGPSPAFILAFSIMILNTDAHSSNIKDKMTLAQFIRNNRGIDDGQDLPVHLLEGIYQRITTKEILLERRGIIQSFPSMKGRTRSKKRLFMFSASGSSHTTNSTTTTTSTATATATTPTKANGSNTTSTMNTTAATTPTKAAETTMTQGRGRSLSRQCEMDYIIERSLEEVTRDVSREVYNSLTSAAVAGALLESTWTALLVAFSLPMEETENMDLIDTCLEGIEYAIKISCRFSSRTERKAFMSALLAFTHLTNLREIEYKSLKSIVVLIRIALEEGDYLESSWYEILHCISLLAKLQILAESSPALPSPSRGGTNSMGNDTSMGDDSSTQSSNGTKKERVKLERQNAGTIAKYIDEVEVHRLFSHSSHLKNESVVNFVEALCLVSAEELSENPPRLFSLQKLVEVTDANIGRLRYVWSKMWANVSRHFITVGLGSNQLVSMFVVDHLRQLARKFLLRKELGNFNFQKDVLRPFEVIAFRTNSSALKELIIASLGQMVDLQPESLGSGWKPLLTALGYCVRNEDNEEVIWHSAIVLQCITLHHMRLLNPHDLYCLLMAWKDIGCSHSSEGICQVAVWFIRFIPIVLIACDVIQNVEMDDVNIILEKLPYQSMSSTTRTSTTTTTTIDSIIENFKARGNGMLKKGNDSLLSLEVIKYMTFCFTSSFQQNEVEKFKIKQNTISFSSLAVSVLASLVMNDRVSSDAINAMMILMSNLHDILTIDSWWYIFSSTVPSTFTYLLEQSQLYSDKPEKRLSLIKQTVMGIVRFSQYNYSTPSLTVDHAIFLLRILFGGICIDGNDAAVEIGFHGARQILHNFEKYTGIKNNNENLWNDIVKYIQEVGNELKWKLESTWCYSLSPTRVEEAVSITLALLHYVKSLRDVALMEGLTISSRTEIVKVLLDILRAVMLLLRSSFSTLICKSEETHSYSLALFIALERSVCNILMTVDEQYNTFMKDHVHIFWSLIVEQLAFLSPTTSNAHLEEAESLRELVGLILDTLHQLPVSLMIPRVKASMPLFCQLITINDKRFAASLGSLFLKYHTASAEMS